jgi:hypothetical protein
MMRIEFKDPSLPESYFGTIKDVDGTEYKAIEI